MRRHVRLSAAWAIGVTLATGEARAQQAGDTDLTKESQNPVAAFVVIPFQESVDVDATHAASFSLRIQPIIPTRLTENWLLVSRVLVNAALVRVDASREPDEATGVGDVTPTFFFSPARAGRVVWGIGPTVLMPTATGPGFGRGKWAIGPAVAIFTQPHWGTVGVVVHNKWSIAGDPTRSAVDQLALELSLSRDLADRWFFTSHPEVDANWNLHVGRRWTVPMGGGIGHVFEIGKQRFSGAVTVYRNVISAGSARWQINAQLALLLPDKRAKQK